MNWILPLFRRGGLHRPGKNVMQGILAALLAVLTYFGVHAAFPELGESPTRMLAIFTFAVVLWVTEAIPLFATSLVVLACQVWFLTVMPGNDVVIDSSAFFAAMGNPIIVIFLGGFILAQAVQQEKIDEQMASLLLRPFGTHPWAIMAGLMLITAIFSMWMSNTATTAMMIVMIGPILRQIPDDKALRKALVLSIPFGANIGGVGTPIGTPPNAIAVAQLHDRGMDIDFLTWMMLTFPILIGGLVLMWALLLAVYRPPRTRLQLETKGDFRMSFKAFVVYATFTLTVGLWLIGGQFGVPTAVAAAVPVAILTATGVIGRADFNRLDWATLALIAGGIALGSGITESEVDAWIMTLVPQEGLTIMTLAALCCVVVVAMSTIMSNTVACNIILPLALALGVGLGGETEMQVMAVMIAVGASFGMGLPISTPPNVIAYSSGEIDTRDMLRVGGLTSIVVTAFIVLTGPRVLTWLLG